MVKIAGADSKVHAQYNVLGKSEKWAMSITQILCGSTRYSVSRREISTTTQYISAHGHTQ